MELTRDDFDDDHIVAEWTAFSAGNNHARDNGDHVLLLSTGQYVLLDKNRIVDSDRIAWDR